MAKPSTVPQVTELIGRHKERVLIQAAIEGKWRRKWDKLFKDEPDQVEQIQRALREPSIVLYFWGEGGIGKSRLLKGVESILAKCENGTSCRHSGIIDLYDADLHNPREFESVLRESLGDKRGFTRYQSKKSHYDKLVKKGAPAELIAQLREELIGAFVADFNKLSARVRPVICLDTVEVLQYEKSVIEEICGPLDVAVELQNWLIKVIPQLKNAVIILSARPRKELEDSFRQYLGKSFISQEVRGFATVDETREYFASAKRKPAVAEALKAANLDERVVHKYTNGEPLLVAMIVDLAVYKVALPPYLYHTWEEAERQSKEVEKIMGSIHRDVAEKIMMLGEDLGHALPYWAWAQKGVDFKALREILGWEESRVRALWDKLQDEEQCPSFIKVRPKSGIVFLHDEMYRLILENVTIRASVEGVRETVCDKLIPYYEQRIKKSKDKQRHRFQIEQLYYKLVKHPFDGYMAYAEMADEAVVGHEVEFVTNLEAEVRRFFELYKWALSLEEALTWNRINRGFAIRSVRRLLAETRFEKAIEVAEKLQQSYLVNHKEDPHFYWFLHAYKGEGMAYTKPMNPETLRILDEARKHFEEMPEPKDKRLRFLRLETLARIHNDIGYVYARLRRLDEAVHEYDRALEYYDQVNLPTQKADTLRNLADVYQRQGDLETAKEKAIESLRNSEKSGDKKLIGLSLSVLARIKLAEEYPEDAHRLAQQALRAFRQIEFVRGQGLAHITLGQADRKRVGIDIEEVGRKEAEAHLQESLEHLDLARDIFENQIKGERIRLIEVYAQRGCTWRDWATFYHQKGIGDTKIPDLAEKAEKDFQEAIKIAQEEGLIAEVADILNDQAEIYYHAKDFDRAEQYLTQSDEQIKAKGDYFIAKGKGMPAPTEEITLGFWQILGKNSLIRARIAFEQGRYESAMEQYLLTYLYFQKFSAESPEFAVRESVRKELKSRLRRLPSPKAEHLRKLGGFLKKVAEEYLVTDQAATHQILDIVVHCLNKEKK